MDFFKLKIILSKIKKLSLAQRILFIIGVSAFIFAIIIVPITCSSKNTNQRPQTYSILLPNDQKYIEAWSPFLPQIAEVSHVSHIEIITYSSASELESFFLKPEYHNLLCAQIPLDGTLNISKIAKKNLFAEIDQRVQLVPHQSIITGIKKSFIDLSEKVPPFIPMTYNPWILLSYKKTPETLSGNRTKILYALGAKEDDYALASLSAARSNFNEEKTNATNKINTIEYGLNLLYKLKINTSFQPNSANETFQDAKSFFSTGNTDFLFLPFSEYYKMPITEIENYNISTPSRCLIANMTGIFFPEKQSKREKSIFSALQMFLCLPNVQSQIAKNLNVLPTNESIWTESLLGSLVQTAEISIIPNLQYKTEQEREFILQSIRQKLSTDY